MSCYYEESQHTCVLNGHDEISFYTECRNTIPLYKLAMHTHTFQSEIPRIRFRTGTAARAGRLGIPADKMCAFTLLSVAAYHTDNYATLCVCFLVRSPFSLGAGLGQGHD